MDYEELLIREYEKLVDLFSSESRTALELFSIWIAIQVGLGSAAALLYVQKATWGSNGFLIIFLAGVFSNLYWIFMQSRARMWRENWVLEGLKLERELENRGLKLEIFRFENRVRDEEVALEFFKNEIKDRKQHFWERFGELRIAHYGMVLMLAVWFLLFLASLFY